MNESVALKIRMIRKSVCIAKCKLQLRNEKMSLEDLNSWNTQQLQCKLHQLQLEKIQAEKEAIQLNTKLIDLGIQIGSICNELTHRRL